MPIASDGSSSPMPIFPNTFVEFFHDALYHVQKSHDIYYTFLACKYFYTPLALMPPSTASLASWYDTSKIVSDDPLPRVKRSKPKNILKFSWFAKIQNITYCYTRILSARLFKFAKVLYMDVSSTGLVLYVKLTIPNSLSIIIIPYFI